MIEISKNFWFPVKGTKDLNNCCWLTVKYYCENLPILFDWFVFKLRLKPSWKQCREKNPPSYSGPGGEWWCAILNSSGSDKLIKAKTWLCLHSSMASFFIVFYWLFNVQAAEKSRRGQWRSEASSQLEMCWTRNNTSAGLKYILPWVNPWFLMLKTKIGFLHFWESRINHLQIQVLASISTHLHVSKDPALGQVFVL